MSILQIHFLFKLDFQNVIAFKHFLCYWALWGESTGDCWITLTIGLQCGALMFVLLAMNKPLGKQLICQWFEMPW